MSLLRRELHLGCPPAHAFAVFTQRIDAWWPRGHRKDPGAEMVLEGAVGGRLFERSEAGEHEHGRVLEWAPPTTLRYSWRPGAPVGRATEVEVRFSAVEAGTLVQVLHAEGTAGLGSAWPRRAERFDRAWTAVLAAFSDHLERR